MTDTKLLALYLPQYYETDYNSNWWGDGYTEWTACKQAKPLFKNHQQPKLPANDHYYDLSQKEEIVWQCKLAKEHGIDGFAIYQYYSVNNSTYGKKNGQNGSMLLNVPTEIIRDNPDIDINYFLYWANHDWRKTWFGQDPTMLWRQQYGTKEDWVEFYNYNRDYFLDNRYIKVDNKPVYFIFAVWHFKEIEQFMECWNELAKKDGFDGIYFVKTDDAHSAAQLGPFDATYKREPFATFGKKSNVLDFISRGIQRKGIPVLNKILNHVGTGIISYKYDYEKLWRSILQNDLNSTVIPGCVADWDNTARKGYNGQILTGVSPQLFGKYFRLLMEKCRANDVRFVVINAWNEWAEGAYLEPDKVHGDAFLQEIEELKMV